VMKLLDGTVALKYSGKMFMVVKCLHDISKRKTICHVILHLATVEST